MCSPSIRGNVYNNDIDPRGVNNVNRSQQSSSPVQSNAQQNPTPAQNTNSSTTNTQATTATPPVNNDTNLHRSSETNPNAMAFNNLTNAVNTIRNNPSVMTPQMREVMGRIEAAGFSNANANDLKALQNMARDQLKILGPSADSGLQTSLNSISKVSEAMILNMQQQDTLRDRIGRSQGQIDNAIGRMTAAINSLPEGNAAKKVLQDVMALYNDSNDPAVKFLMSRYIDNVINNVDNLATVQRLRDEFCGRNSRGEFSSDSVLGKLKNIPAGPNQLEEMARIMGDYAGDPEVYRALLSQDIGTQNADSGAQGPGGMRATSAGDASPDLSMQNADPGTQDSGGTARDRAAQILGDVMKFETDEKFIDADERLNEVFTNPEVARDFEKGLAESGIQETLQDMINTELRPAMNTMRDDCRQLLNLQSEMRQMTSQLQNAFSNFRSVSSESQTSSSQDGGAEAIMQERTNQVIAEADRLEGELNLEMENGEDVSQLLKRFREIIVDLDIDLRDNARKSNESSFISNSNQSYMRDMKLRSESIDKVKNEINEIYKELQQVRLSKDNNQFQLLSF